MRLIPRWHKLAACLNSKFKIHNSKFLPPVPSLFWRGETGVRIKKSILVTLFQVQNRLAVS